MRENTPVLPGFIERCTDGVAGPPAMLLHVWCRWCCRFHEHGLADLQVGDTTHRVAHCYAPDSEYDDRGYNIRVTDVPFSTARRRVRSASVAQRASIQAGRISEAVQKLRDQPSPVA
jgi:hypothetical protein